MDFARNRWNAYLDGTLCFKQPVSATTIGAKLQNRGATWLLGTRLWQQLYALDNYILVAVQPMPRIIIRTISNRHGRQLR